jgi:bifunctional N-acetylglucosamine-1-phosphate-uridyltransferase/glucosamine-1-phosphate-acetyltransferase GlmU-like protein/uncharacterized protein with ATP-grasp and redox domains
MSREELESKLNRILGVRLRDELGEELADRFLSAVWSKLKSDDLRELRRLFDPQWVVLAAGKGTRIDPESLLNKNLDIWFGESNVLQLALRHLPGTRPPIVVVNPQMRKRIESEGIERLIGREVLIAVQEIPNGTGGALMAASKLLEESEAELLGVAFGDEPFLDRDMFLMTLVDHIVKGADITLCAKIPETVVEKGGLFFDDSGKLIGTREWAEMSEDERREILDRFRRGEGYTNTGVTVAQRDEVLKRLNRLRPHLKGELHHVDLIRIFYEDGLRTNAYIYRNPIPPGINRWSAVAEGEIRLFNLNRRELLRRGVRVDPYARITAERGYRIGRACYLLGRVHIGGKVEIGNYCRIEDSILTGSTHVGDRVGLREVIARDVSFESNPLSQPLGEPIFGLRVKSEILNCRLEDVVVKPGVKLRNVEARYTVIPPGVNLSDMKLGRWERGDMVLDVLDGLVEGEYMPGRPLSQEEGNVKGELLSFAFNELIPRSTINPKLMEIARESLRDLMEMNGIEDLTVQEVQGIIFEIVRLCTGNPDPYFREKLNLRERGFKLIEDDAGERELERLLEEVDIRRKGVLILSGREDDAVVDIWLAGKLAEKGCRVTIAGKGCPIGVCATVEGLSEIRRELNLRGIAVISSGSRMPGVNLFQATGELLNALIESDLVICRGRDNWETTMGLNKTRLEMASY